LVCEKFIFQIIDEGKDEVYVYPKR